MKRKSIPELIFSNWPVKVLSLSIAVVLFLLYRLATQEERFFNIPITLTVNDEYIPSGNYPRKVRITLKGQENDIFLVMEEDIEAEVDLSGFVNEGIFKAPVLIHKKGNALTLENIEIRVDPIQITVALERKIKKSLEVFPTISGSPVEGYDLTQFVISPTYVDVEGPKNVLQEISTVRTEDIDLDGKTESFTIRVRLKYDDSVIYFPGGDIVEFSASIRESIILKSYTNLTIELTGLPPNMAVLSPPAKGMVQIQGSQLKLQAIRLSDLRLTADCTKIKTPGIHTVPVTCEFPEGMTLISYIPEDLRIETGWEEEP
ncbi:MAG: hypothetical protein E4H36_02085 [Spirochaetales bacterium]|nr:MAG: hypothetical protein E4H36_02085 [Spirochaetales bacterium]